MLQGLLLSACFFFFLDTSGCRKAPCRISISKVKFRQLTRVNLKSSTSISTKIRISPGIQSSTGIYCVRSTNPNNAITLCSSSTFLKRPNFATRNFATRRFLPRTIVSVCEYKLPLCQVASLSNFSPKQSRRISQSARASLLV